MAKYDYAKIGRTILAYFKAHALYKFFQYIKKIVYMYLVNTDIELYIVFLQINNVFFFALNYAKFSV